VRFAPLRRGGRVVECGSLENCLGGIPSYEGSNPSPSATEFTMLPGHGSCLRVGGTLRKWYVAATIGA
jgi:hypothetical protein